MLLLLPWRQMSARLSSEPTGDFQEVRPESVKLNTCVLHRLSSCPSLYFLQKLFLFLIVLAFKAQIWLWKRKKYLWESWWGLSSASSPYLRGDVDSWNMTTHSSNSRWGKPRVLVHPLLLKLMAHMGWLRKETNLLLQASGSPNTWCWHPHDIWGGFFC